MLASEPTDSIKIGTILNEIDNNYSEYASYVLDWKSLKKKLQKAQDDYDNIPSLVNLLNSEYLKIIPLITEKLPSILHKIDSAIDSISAAQSESESGIFAFPPPTSTISLPNNSDNQNNGESSSLTPTVTSSCKLVKSLVTDSPLPLARLSRLLCVYSEDHLCSLLQHCEQLYTDAQRIGVVMIILLHLTVHVSTKINKESDFAIRIGEYIDSLNNSSMTSNLILDDSNTSSLSGVGDGSIIIESDNPITLTNENNIHLSPPSSPRLFSFNMLPAHKEIMNHVIRALHIDVNSHSDSITTDTTAVDNGGVVGHEGEDVDGETITDSTLSSPPSPTTSTSSFLHSDLTLKSPLKVCLRVLKLHALELNHLMELTRCELHNVPAPTPIQTPQTSISRTLLQNSHSFSQLSPNSHSRTYPQSLTSRSLSTHQQQQQHQQKLVSSPRPSASSPHLGSPLTPRTSIRAVGSLTAMDMLRLDAVKNSLLHQYESEMSDAVRGDVTEDSQYKHLSGVSTGLPSESNTNTDSRRDSITLNNTLNSGNVNDNDNSENTLSSSKGNSVDNTEKSGDEGEEDSSSGEKKKKDKKSKKKDKKKKKKDLEDNISELESINEAIGGDSDLTEDLNSLNSIVNVLNDLDSIVGDVATDSENDNENSDNEDGKKKKKKDKKKDKKKKKAQAEAEAALALSGENDDNTLTSDSSATDLNVTETNDVNTSVDSDNMNNPNVSTISEDVNGNEIGGTTIIDDNENTTIINGNESDNIVEENESDSEVEGKKKKKDKKDKKKKKKDKEKKKNKDKDREASEDVDSENSKSLNTSSSPLDLSISDISVSDLSVASNTNTNTVNAMTPTPLSDLRIGSNNTRLSGNLDLLTSDDLADEGDDVGDLVSPVIPVNSDVNNINNISTISNSNSDSSSLSLASSESASTGSEEERESEDEGASEGGKKKKKDKGKKDKKKKKDKKNQGDVGEAESTLSGPAMVELLLSLYREYTVPALSLLLTQTLRTISERNNSNISNIAVSTDSTLNNPNNTGITINNDNEGVNSHISDSNANANVKPTKTPTLLQPVGLSKTDHINMYGVGGSSMSTQSFMSPRSKQNPTSNSNINVDSYQNNVETNSTSALPTTVSESSLSSSSSNHPIFDILWFLLPLHEHLSLQLGYSFVDAAEREVDLLFPSSHYADLLSISLTHLITLAHTLTLAAIAPVIGVSVVHYGFDPWFAMLLVCIYAFSALITEAILGVWFSDNKRVISPYHRLINLVKSCLPCLFSSPSRPYSELHSQNYNTYSSYGYGSVDNATNSDSLTTSASPSGYGSMDPYQLEAPTPSDTAPMSSIAVGKRRPPPPISPAPHFHYKPSFILSALATVLSMATLASSSGLLVMPYIVAACLLGASSRVITVHDLINDHLPIFRRGPVAVISWLAHTLGSFLAPLLLLTLCLYTTLTNTSEEVSGNGVEIITDTAANVYNKLMEVHDNTIGATGVSLLPTLAELTNFTSSVSSTASDSLNSINAAGINLSSVGSNPITFDASNSPNITTAIPFDPATLYTLLLLLWLAMLVLMTFGFVEPPFRPEIEDKDELTNNPNLLEASSYNPCMNDSSSQYSENHSHSHLSGEHQPLLSARRHVTGNVVNPEHFKLLSKAGVMVMRRPVVVEKKEKDKDKDGKKKKKKKDKKKKKKAAETEGKGKDTDVEDNDDDNNNPEELDGDEDKIDVDTGDQTADENDVTTSLLSPPKSSLSAPQMTRSFSDSSKRPSLEQDHAFSHSLAHNTISSNDHNNHYIHIPVHPLPPLPHLTSFYTLFPPILSLIASNALTVTTSLALAIVTSVSYGWSLIAVAAALLLLVIPNTITHIIVAVLAAKMKIRNVTILLISQLIVLIILAFAIAVPLGSGPLVTLIDLSSSKSSSHTAHPVEISLPSDKVLNQGGVANVVLLSTPTSDDVDYNPHNEDIDAQINDNSTSINTNTNTNTNTSTNILAETQPRSISYKSSSLPPSTQLHLQPASSSHSKLVLILIIVTSIALSASSASAQVLLSQHDHPLYTHSWIKSYRAKTLIQLLGVLVAGLVLSVALLPLQIPSEALGKISSDPLATLVLACAHVNVHGLLTTILAPLMGLTFIAFFAGLLTQHKLGMAPLFTKLEEI